jgi:hypothetical protein
VSPQPDVHVELGGWLVYMTDSMVDGGGVCMDIMGWGWIGTAYGVGKQTVPAKLLLLDDDEY